MTSKKSNDNSKTNIRSNYKGAADPALACYSYLRVWTGSRRAARLAGSVPKSTPTRTEVESEMTADQDEMGILNGVRKLTDMGIARPTTVPMMPPESERKTASVRNWRRISRLVAPRALRMPISLMRDCTLASILFMMPTPETTRVMAAASVSTMVNMLAIWAITLRTCVRLKAV